jgi:hypothetical protein
MASLFIALHRHPLLAAAAPRAAAAEGGAQQSCTAEKMRCSAPESAVPDLLLDDRPVPDGRHQPGRKLGRRRRAGDASPVSRPADAQGAGETRCARRSASAACSCGSSWRRFAFGAVFDGLGAVRAIETLFLERWGLEPWQVLIMMQLSYL